MSIEPDSLAAATTAPLSHTVHGEPLVIEGGTQASAVFALERAIGEALDAYSAARPVTPLFVVPPGTSASAAAAEVAHLGYPEGTGVLMRTSGSTTGTGKIVAMPWEAVIASATATHAALAGPGAWITVLPIHHIAGFQTVTRSVIAGYSPIAPDMNGEASARVSAASSAPDESLRTAVMRTMVKGSAAPAVYLSQVPTQLSRSLTDPQLCEFIATHIAADVVGGAALTSALLDAARSAGIPIRTSYGMTETCGGCVYDGFPIGDTTITIDTAGRISLTGSATAFGYLGDVGADAFSTTTIDGRTLRTHHTQDAGALTGKPPRLSVLGRIDDAITTGGLTIMPALIEDAVARGFAVDSIVVGVPDALWGERAVIVAPTPLDLGAVRDYIGARFEKGWAPRQALTLSQLDLGAAQRNADGWPITASGKIDRRALQRAVRAFAA
ncbi:MAG: AMP-binding protein [Actinomycetaceae bacterium]|nr:AMP-binding protein [Arcanobacterium sp.]MDD7505215.1 AMP-binding protein [Actinomycetaceae bacterium]MDY6143303.1 AMP-binding protein [Arcanobacterium sp.]